MRIKLNIAIILTMTLALMVLLALISFEAGWLALTEFLLGCSMVVTLLNIPLLWKVRVERNAIREQEAKPRQLES